MNCWSVDWSMGVADWHDWLARTTWIRLGNGVVSTRQEVWKRRNNWRIYDKQYEEQNRVYKNTSSLENKPLFLFFPGSVGYYDGPLLDGRSTGAVVCGWAGQRAPRQHFIPLLPNQFDEKLIKKQVSVESVHINTHSMLSNVLASSERCLGRWSQTTVSTMEWVL